MMIKLAIVDKDALFISFIRSGTSTHPPRAGGNMPKLASGKPSARFAGFLRTIINYY